MAFLNEYKRRALRREPVYQCLIEDLFEKGVINAVSADELLLGVPGYVPHVAKENPANKYAEED